MAVRRSFNFRSTLGDVHNEAAPAVAIVNEDVYPTERNGYTFGTSDATWGAQDITTSPVDARTSGRMQQTSNGRTLRIELLDGPGEYKLWLGEGAVSTAITSAIELTDGTSTSSTVLLSNAAASIASGSSRNAQGEIKTLANWRADYETDFVTVTFASTTLLIEKVSGSGLYLHHLALEKVVEPLQDATLTHPLGQPATTAGFYARQPAGTPLARIAAPIGVSNFALAEANAYVAVQQIDDEWWLVSTATPIPDALGTLNVGINQIDPNETNRTDFAIPITTSNNRLLDGSVVGRLTTETYLRRQAVINEMALIWPGYQGQTIDPSRDVLVTSPAEFQTAYNSFAAALTAGNTHWYRIRCGGLLWTGGSIVMGKNNWRGAGGGLLIEPAAGMDPLIVTPITNMRDIGVEWRGLRVTTQGPRGYSFDVPLLSGDLAPPWGVFKFKTVRFGAKFKDVPDPNSNHPNWGTPIQCMYANEVIFEDCHWAGVWNAMNINGCHRLLDKGGRYEYVASDFHAINTAFRLNTPLPAASGFSTNAMWVHFVDCVVRLNPDIYTGIPTANVPHSDWIQTRRPDAMYRYEARPNGGSTTRWFVAGDPEANLPSNYTYSAAANRIYRVSATAINGIYPAGVATGTAVLTGPGPIVDGGVTWEDHGPNMGRPCHILNENVCIIQDGDSVSNEGNSSPNVQTMIGSNSGQGSSWLVTFLNTLVASNSSYGIQFEDGSLHAEFCTFVGPGRRTIAGNNQPFLRCNRGHTWALHNFLGYLSTGPQGTNIYNDDDSPIFAHGNIPADFQPASSGARLPASLFRGTFTNATPDGGWGYSIDQSSARPFNDLRSDLMKQFLPLTPAGARLRASFPLVFTETGTGQTVQRELVVNP